MLFILIIVIFLAVGIGFLAFYLIRNGVLSGKTAKTAGLVDKNKNLQAIKEGKAAVEKNPKDAEAHFYLGKAFLAEKRDEQALREFKSVSRLGIEGKNIPENEFRQTIAALYVQFNETEEALKEYLLLIKNRPENPEYYFQAGIIFNNRNRGDLAENYLKKAISLNPKESRYYAELGVILYQAKKLKEADTTLEAALKLDPGSSKIHFYKGKIHKDAKDYNAALPFLERASHDPEYKIRSLIESGSCYMSLKMTDKAITELERAIKIIENDAGQDSLYARYFLGMCYEKKQDYPKAIAQWEKIYAQKKNFQDVGEKLTQYQEYRQAGRK